MPVGHGLDAEGSSYDVGTFTQLKEVWVYSWNRLEPTEAGESCWNLSRIVDRVEQ